ncbi:helix-turn-helix transcriptional regulator [Bacillus atrophaeus]|uniref:helix-turn-helix domain-containing protein n=1 Tax=Bacillus atrophaeus TaxID=1452 RepID=UPI00227E6E6C|nr:helix-turn-helix transcriptional regulator [Bacillus atrophaeus]MCY9198915.1 helix-turn-helix transcriptional regulator [Bacillus atrophaeus]
MKLRLKEILNGRHIEQKDLAIMAGLSERTISELCNNKVKRYPIDALDRIILVLDIKDANELFDIQS